MLDKSVLKKAFNQAADTYDRVAALAEETAQDLVDRLQYMAVKPAVILDVGAGTGFVAKALSKSAFSKAYTIELDCAIKLLQAPKAVCADTLNLPIKSHSIDLLISNLCLPFVNDLQQVMTEWQRVLKPGGLCLFSTLGPDTLTELRDAFAAVDHRAHVHGFYDMHDVGDALLKSGFAEPVMDVDVIDLQYKNLENLFASLKQQGVTNALKQRSRGLLTPNIMAKVKQAYPKKEGLLPVTVEVVFGSAWATDVAAKKNLNNEVYIPVESILRRK